MVIVMNFVDENASLPGGSHRDRAAEPSSSGYSHGRLSDRRVPTVADYRRRMVTRDRWHTSGALMVVAAVTFLVFWLLPQH